MSIADTGTKLLAEFGEAVTLNYETGEVRNPATGEVTTPASENVVPGFGYPGNFQNAEVDGTVIKRSDTRLILNKVSVRAQEPGGLAGPSARQDVPGHGCAADHQVGRRRDLYLPVEGIA